MITLRMARWQYYALIVVLIWGVGWFLETCIELADLFIKGR